MKKNRLREIWRNASPSARALALGRLKMDAGSCRSHAAQARTIMDLPSRYRGSQTREEQEAFVKLQIETAELLEAISKQLVDLELEVAPVEPPDPELQTGIVVEA